MPQFEFLYNLGKVTHKARIGKMVNPAGYLLSVHRYTPQFINFALELNDSYDEVVLADNGFFRKISLLIKEFKLEADALLKQVIAIEKQKDRKVRRGELPAKLTSRYRKLARKIRSTVYKIEKESDLTHTLKKQAKIKPDRFICFEDILQASLVGLNMEPEYLSESRGFYAYRNKRSARFYKKIVDGKYGEYTGVPYAVASAVDYNSAFDAGREMAKKGITHLAIGAGAYMVDNHYMDHYYIQRKRIELGRNLPRRYIRSAYALKGLLDGYYTICADYPQGIHYLGMGAPIMILITALISQHVKTVSYDATSPIKDAVQGVLYVTKPSFLKYRSRKLALYYAKNPDDAWKCSCIYCKKFLAQYPMDYKAANRWWKTQSEDLRLKASHLKEGTPLAKALPLFSEPKGGQARKDVNEWRQGHNHIMLERLMARINKASKQNKLLHFVERKVADYTRRSVPHYAVAVEHALKLASSTYQAV